MALYLDNMDFIEWPEPWDEYHRSYWFDSIERKDMFYEDICQRYGVDDMEEEELVKRGYIKIDRVKIEDVCRDFARKFFPEDVQKMLDGKSGMDCWHDTSLYAEQMGLEEELNLFKEGVNLYCANRLAVQNRIPFCTLAIGLRRKIMVSQDPYGMDVRGEIREISKKEVAEEEEFKQTLPKRMDY